MKKLIYLFSAILLVSNNYAQTGPGGVGSSANNVIWLDAENLTYSTFPNISSWPDQSGNGNNFTQATGSLQPYKVNYGSSQSLRFRGDYIVNTGIGALNTNTITQYYVFEGGQPNHIGVLLDASHTQSIQFLRTERSNANIRSLVLDNGGIPKINSTTISSSFQIMSSIWDGAGAQTFNSFKNGTSFGSQTSANGNPTGNYQNTIGAAINGGKLFQGDISEVITYNTVLNSAQRTLVDNYLASKHGVSISNDKYVYDATHKYQVFGMGQEADGGNLTAQGKGIVQFSTGSLSNGTYVLAGHENTVLSSTTNDVPATLVGGSRLSRTWRADVTGAPGTITVVYDVSTLPLSSGAYYLLVENDNGIFNDGGVTEYGPFADVGGLVTFSNVSLAAGNYFTIASGTNVGITSIATGFWDVASTWSCSCIPTTTDDVTITNGHTVTARTAITVNKLTINGSLNTSPTNTFNVKGDYTIGTNGSATHKVVTFNGTINQKVTNNSAGTFDFSTLVINNTANVGLYTGKFSISVSAKITAGQLQNISGTCTFTSTATRTAVILNSAGNGFSGQFIVQRYISQRNEGWGDIASPVTNNHLRDWDTNPAGTVRELLMCGVNGISGNCGGWNSVYYYNESTQAYVAVTDTSYVLAPGKSVEMWLADDTATFNNTTFDSRGVPNYGNVPVAVANSWNLVGNPYQAWINWTSLTKPTLNSTYYIWNTNNSSYDAKTSGSIPPHQGFWVESTGAGTLTFTESAKNNSASSTFWRMTDQEDIEPVVFTESILKIKSNKYPYAHELKLRLNDLASSGLDEFDASFKASIVLEAPSITASIKKSSKQLAITSFNRENEVIIPITVTVGIESKYIIEAISFENLNAIYNEVVLIDTKYNKSYNLKSLKEIEIDLTLNEDDNRFNLRLSNNFNQTISSSDFNTNIYKTQDHTIIEFDNINTSYSVSIVNMLGQKVIDDYLNVSDSKLMIPNSSLPTGVNIITVRDNNNVSVKKLNY